jgi:UDP-4-amino-4-deoxy-L-arabinose formyltransferase/UDP-glucuronic acid dehydrogenase (UDP-4-keto-hexauronic acid decarboxylating)
VRDPAFAQEIADRQVDLLLNVHSLYVIKGPLIDACRIGAFNMHPGPLPHYAGLNVPSWAIYNGETQHAVTVHEMTPEIDAGTIAYQKRFPVEPTETGFSLMAKCIRAGVPLIEQLLDAAAQGADTIPRIPQDFSRRRYFGRKAPNAGQIEWDWTATDVVNHVRASDYAPFVSPWGCPETRLGGDIIGILKAEHTGQSHDGMSPGTVGESSDRGIHVAASDEWVLVRKIRMNDRNRNAAEVLKPGQFLQASAPTMVSG